MAEGENATTSRKLKHSWQIHEENRKLRPQSMTADLSSPRTISIGSSSAHVARPANRTPRK